MNSLLVGTAGHIDHGKTSLIKCLTGIDTDRLPEEKKRGISIELGFAWIKLPSGKLCSFIDVPGHEKFIKTMVAGSHSLDAALLVIAADEGIKAQTQEHLQVLKYMGISSIIVVLSKCDLVTAEFVEQRRKEITSSLQSIQETVAIYPFSSETLEGRNHILNALESIPPKVHHDEAPFRLYVDRVFSLKGLGTVAAGTILEGTLEENDIVFIQGMKKSRIKKLHSHGKEIQKISAGERVALNLSDISVREIDRGDLITKDKVELHRIYEVQYRFHSDVLKHDSQDLKSQYRAFQFHIHSSKTIVHFSAPHSLTGSFFARFQLFDSLYLKPGDRFVLRRFGVDEKYGSVVGGGIILHQAFLKRVEPLFLFLHHTYLESGNINDFCEFIHYYLDKINPQGMTLEGLYKIFYINIKMTSNIKEQSLRKDILFSNNYIILKKHFEIYCSRIISYLTVFLKENSFKQGCTCFEVMSGLNIRRELLDFIIQNREELQIKEDIVSFNNKEHYQNEPIFEKIENILKCARFRPPSLKEISETMSITEKETIDILNGLVSSHKIKRIKYGFYIHSDIFNDFEEKIKDQFVKIDQLDINDFKNLTGASRKFTIPLIEYCDQIMLTLRRGDKRKLNPNYCRQ